MAKTMEQTNRDYALAAHQAAEEHLDACWEAWEAENDEAEPGREVQWPDVAGPFCGCQTCEVREILHAAWPHLLEAARAELGAAP